MKLSRVAQRFNDNPCMDAYTGDYLFSGQLGVYTEAVRDGITTQRRVLELAPHTEIPLRRVIDFGGESWILGDGNIDMWKGKVIREKFPIHKSKGLANILTPHEFVTGQVGVLAHAGLVFVKTNKEVEESSGEFNQSTMYFSMSERVQERGFVKQGGRAYIVKESYPATAGHLGVIVEQLDAPYKEIAQTQGQKDVVTEEYQPGENIPLIKLRWQTDFRYFSQVTPTFLQGDMQTVTASEYDIKGGDRLTLSDGEWSVINRVVEGDVQYLHLRRA